MVDLLGDPQIIDMGNFRAGERPDPVRYQFLKWDGTAIDISSPDATEFRIVKDDATTGYLGAGAITIEPDDDLILSIAQYAWTLTDMQDPGHYEGEIWIEKGTLVAASLRFKWYVARSISAGA